jgi:protein dithiol oxidoreductase (disulfide-forming)
MRVLHRVVAAASLCLAAFAACASPSNPQNGVDYRTLERAQQTDSAGKVEVTEFFWYSCPHCSAFEPSLADWVKRQGDKIVFKRVPVAFRPSMVPQQKLYYTLEALGKSEEFQGRIFQAIHVQRLPLDAENAIVEFMVKQGFDRKQFLDVYNSFAVQTKARRAAQLQESYHIDGVPLVAVDGRYLTAPSIAGATLGTRDEAALHVATVQVLDWLVAQTVKRNGAPAATADAGKKAPAAAGK